MSVARVVEVRLGDEVVWKAALGNPPVMTIPGYLSGTGKPMLISMQQDGEGAPHDPVAHQ